MAEILCTRRDYERARKNVLRHFQEYGFATRRELSNFRVWGLPYEAIELAIRNLRNRGEIEELYVLPRDTKRNGQRPEYYGLTTALDAKQITLPEGIVRERYAFEALIADLEEAESA